MARDFKPSSRSEKILAATIDGTEYTEKPKSRIEELLLELKELIEGGGSSTDYATDINFSIDSSTFVITTQLKNKDGDPLGTAKTVDIPLESTVIGGSYNAQTKQVVLTLQSGDTVAFSVADLVNGLLPDNGNYTEFTNGVRLYVSDTEPTGTIPEGSIGIGW